MWVGVGGVEGVVGGYDVMIMIKKLLLCTDGKFFFSPVVPIPCICRFSTRRINESSLVTTVHGYRHSYLNWPSCIISHPSPPSRFWFNWLTKKKKSSTYGVEQPETSDCVSYDVLSIRNIQVTDSQIYLNFPQIRMTGLA